MTAVLEERAQSTFVGGVWTHARVLAPRQGPVGWPVVLVPGLGCASWMYRRVGERLAREQGRTVYLYDPPGHGHSGGGRGRVAHIHELTDHLAAWLEARELIGAALLGHSLGGEVIFDLAARYPQHARALIACAPTGIPENPSVAAQFARLLLDVPRERPGLLLPGGLRAYARAGARTMFRLAQDQHAHQTGPLLSRVEAPTLLIGGDRDPVIHAWTVEALRRAVPHAVVRVVQGGTHALTDSHPRTVARYAHDFLARVEGPPAPPARADQLNWTQRNCV
ncbi:Lysophospholipase, alpha-beta hydrolase superfamily [Deinococcus reticulitermitis]|uniref:Lysophospholipase, alpha-beta hydrolase superfamily n=1 Tax=Deinococcus reticulitermitis TaxID=856736 RepID=A0A1H7AAR2_9DEIO|nr:alpha/beta hydrolase [Deinococcus reticulitermitis]SEJ61594.1 Lysophospholipase, alpha-beta hydrolase superfamily [Deinococcus reticulitermitis]